MASRIFRFRSVKHLMDYGELEEQYVFFAPLSELNDPMEGLMDIVWSGDEVVWCNLFRHYIRSFQMFYSLFVEAASYLPLDHRHVRVSRNRTQPYFDRRGTTDIQQGLQNHVS